MSVSIENTALPVSSASKGGEKDPGASAASSSSCLVGPWFDLLFLVNLYWPLLFLVDFWGSTETHETMLFWQVFFITTPHRWITLFLVFGDRNRRAERPRTFALTAILIIAICLLVRFSAGSLICLLAVDYLWNGWHFASQHHGIYRIYSRKSNFSTGSSAGIEKWLFRGFLLYIILRIAGWNWDYQTLTTFAQFADFAIMIIPLGLLISRARMIWNGSGTGFLYLCSVMSLFTAMLWAVHTGQRQMVLQLALASAVFHAVEYLAIVTWSVRNPRNQSRNDLFGTVACHWVVYLMAFVVFLGISSWMLQKELFEVWATVNLIVAFLHYSYDGMIWKGRRKRAPAT